MLLYCIVLYLTCIGIQGPEMSMSHVRDQLIDTSGCYTWLHRCSCVSLHVWRQRLVFEGQVESGFVQRATLTVDSLTPLSMCLTLTILPALLKHSPCRQLTFSVLPAYPVCLLFYCSAVELEITDRVSSIVSIDFSLSLEASVFLLPR